MDPTVAKQYETSRTETIQDLSAYISVLMTKYGGTGSWAPTIRHLGELRDTLQEAQLKADSNAGNIKQATAKLVEASNAIDVEMKSDKITQDRIQDAAAIIGLLGAAVSWAVPV